MNLVFVVSLSIFEINSKEIFEVVDNNILLVLEIVMCEGFFYEEIFFLVGVVESVFFYEIFTGEEIIVKIDIGGSKLIFKVGGGIE